MNPNNKSKIKPIHVLSGVLVLFLICSGFGGNYFKNEYDTLIDDLKRQNESIFNASVKTKDSLLEITQNQKLFSDNLRDQNNALQSRNNNLYYELQKRNKQIFVIDTSFILNANRISNSTDRFYKRNDSIR